MLCESQPPTVSTKEFLNDQASLQTPLVNASSYHTAACANYRRWSLEFGRSAKKAMDAS
ncbi:rCG30339 [Rattus norvegicus]|uniref:RCG30339 n=1 Tax=Rattus norvegicus TaxID=10116 RepID=A6IMN8_RAT|nr:rCG30339 [Rattus norvegicus]